MKTTYLIIFHMIADKDLPAARQRQANHEAIATFFADVKEMRAKKAEADTGDRKNSQWGGVNQRIVFYLERCLGQTGT